MSDYSAGDVAVAACDGAVGYCVVVAVGDDVVDDGLSLITARQAAVPAFEYSMGVLCLSMTIDDVVAGRGGCHWVGIDWTELSEKTRRKRPRKTDVTTETAE